MYGTFEADLKGLDVDLEDWLALDPDMRRHTVNHALKARQMDYGPR